MAGHDSTDTALKDPITVVLEDAVPVRLEWNGSRYYIDFPPEPRGRVEYTPSGGQPDPRSVTGWRMSASTPAGDQHVFVINSGGGARWWLTALDPRD